MYHLGKLTNSFCPRKNNSNIQEIQGIKRISDNDY